MTPTEATAEVFLTALRSLSRRERQAILNGIASDDEMREDLLDLALLEQRQEEPARPFKEYLAEKTA